MIDEDFWLPWLAVAMIIAVDYRSGGDGWIAIYLSGFGALAALAWTLSEPGDSWQGWLPCAVILIYGLWRQRASRGVQI